MKNVEREDWDSLVLVQPLYFMYLSYVSYKYLIITLTNN